MNSDIVISHCAAIDSQITKLWEVEAADENVCSPSQEDKRVLDLWEREITHQEGNYTLPIPWKDDKPSSLIISLWPVRYQLIWNIN